MYRNIVLPALVFASLSLSATTGAFAQVPVVGATEFIAAAQRSNESPASPAVVIPATTGMVTIFTSRATFEAIHPGLPMETFEEGNVPEGSFVTCDAPLDATGDEACGFASGTIIPGVTFQDSPGPELGDLILLGAGTALNPSKALITRTFIDGFEVLFSPPVMAAGMDLISSSKPGVGDSDLVSIQLFDANGTLIDSDPTAAASGPGNFWGISSTTPIARIIIVSSRGRAEGVDNISFSADPISVAVVFADGFEK